MKKLDGVVEEKFSKSQDSLVIQQSDLSLRSISEMVHDGAIDVSPKYQRRERWGDKKESDLIESFILNIPVPPIYLAEDSYGNYSVIDGKQRVTAINRFIEGRLSLNKPDIFKELDGCFFDDLPDGIRNALSIRPYLRVVTLLRQSDNELKHEVFLRLNKAGVPLNAQEIRNVAFRGDFNDLLFELSERKFFRRVMKSTPNSKVYREMQDVQFVLRFFSVRKYWQEFPGSMDIAMDNYMVDNYRANESDISVHAGRFDNALNACESIWGNDAFLKPNASKRVLQGFFDIQMVCLSLLSEVERARVLENPDKVKRGLIDLLDEDPDFLESLTQFTSNPARLRYRIETFLNLLKSI